MASVVLLGAGASFGSEKLSQNTPPLGDKLFERLVEQGGIAAQIPDEIKTLFREKGFETGMAEYYRHSGGNIMRFQRELAHYLASFSPSQESAYVQLINTLGTRRFIYCSLNYDLLFELSAAYLQLNTTYTAKRIKGEVSLIKPHGSANFWPYTSDKFTRCTFINAGPGADFQAPIRPLNQIDTINQCLNQDSLAPAIAMYAEGKAVRVSPDYVEEQQQQWIMSAKLAKRVFVVGVRVHLIDHHIWGTLAETKADVIYFGFPNDKQNFDGWKTAFKKKNACFVQSDFFQSINYMRSRTIGRAEARSASIAS
jgi:hypothetical protein